MAYDNDGNWVDDVDPEAQRRQQMDADWQRASQDINRYVSKENAGRSINWDAAKSAFEKNAGAGGNYGDWVNRTMDARESWLSPAAGASSGGNTGIAGGQQGGFDLEGLRKRWMQTGAVHDIGGWLKNNQDIAAGTTLRGEKLFGPNGQFIADLVGNFKGGDPSKFSRIFLDHVGSNGKPRVAGGSQGMLAPGGKGPDTIMNARPAPGAGGGGAGGGGGTGFSDPRMQEFYNRLMGIADQGLAVDRNNPVIRAQADAYAANEERARRDYLADLAEGAGANANLRGEQRLAAERAGSRSGAFEAELMGREVAAKRDEVAQALQQMQGMLTTDQENALRERLARLTDATNRYQADLQAKTSRYGIDVGARTAGRGQDLDWQRALLQNEQFMRQLGFNQWDRENYWDYTNRYGGG